MMLIEKIAAGTFASVEQIISPLKMLRKGRAREDYLRRVFGRLTKEQKQTVGKSIQKSEAAGRKRWGETARANVLGRRTEKTAK